MAEIPGFCAVVITYHPTENIFENLQAIVAVCGQVLVIDNGSVRTLTDRIARVTGVVLMALGKNAGVATGLNKGGIWALERGFSWMIVFDQDSQPAAGFATALWAAHERNPQAAVIGPRIIEANEEERAYRWVRRNPRWPGIFQRVTCDKGDLSEVTMVISSGSLIELETWTRLGGFDEGLFIDYVDTDYCLKVIRSGRRVAVAADASLRHHLGKRSTGRVLGKDLRPMHHASLRHYYMARNRVHLWHRHALAFPHWALFDLSFAAYNTLRVLAFEANKVIKLKALVLGIWDGLAGRFGPCAEYRLRMLHSSNAG
jgi:rhamnosyltransferase